MRILLIILVVLGIIAAAIFIIQNANTDVEGAMKALAAQLATVLSK